MRQQKRADVVSVRHLVSQHARLLVPLATRNVQTMKTNKFSRRMENDRNRSSAQGECVGILLVVDRNEIIWLL